MRLAVLCILLHLSCLLCDHSCGACPVSQQALLQGLAVPARARRVSVPRASRLRAGALCVLQKSHSSQLLDSSVSCTVQTTCGRWSHQSFPSGLVCSCLAHLGRQPTLRVCLWLGRDLRGLRKQPSLRAPPLVLASTVQAVLLAAAFGDSWQPLLSLQWLSAVALDGCSSVASFIPVPCCSDYDVTSGLSLLRCAVLPLV